MWVFLLGWVWVLLWLLLVGWLGLEGVSRHGSGRSHPTGLEVVLGLRLLPIAGLLGQDDRGRDGCERESQQGKKFREHEHSKRSSERQNARDGC